MVGQLKKSHVWLLIFVIGILIGTVFVNYGISDVNYLKGSFLNNYALNMSEYQINHLQLFYHVIFNRLILFTLMFLLVYFLKSNWIIYAVILYYGFSFGALISMFTMSYGMSSYQLFLGMMLPHYLVYIPLYLMYMNWLSELTNQQQKGTGGYYKNSWTKVIKTDSQYVKMAFFVGVLIIGAVLESYVNPEFFKIILKNI